MFTVSVKDEMTERSLRQEKNQGLSLLSEANGILREAEEFDAKTLASAGFHVGGISNMPSDTASEKIRSLMPAGHIVNIDIITDICTRYGLRCLHTQSYRGPVPFELPKIIAAFEVKMKEVFDINPNEKYRRNLSYYGSYKIIAPASLFKLQERPKPNPDPILVFQFDDNRDCVIVHAWGNDLSVWNWVKALPRRNVLTAFAFGLLVLFPSLSVLCANLLQLLFGRSPELCEGIIAAALVPSAACTIWWLIETISNRLTKDNWNSTTE